MKRLFSISVTFLFLILHFQVFSQMDGEVGPLAPQPPTQTNVDKQGNGQPIENPLDEGRKIYQIYKSYQVVVKGQPFASLGIKEIILKSKSLSSHQQTQLDNELAILDALIKGLQADSQKIVNLDAFKDKIPDRFVFLNDIEEALAAYVPPASGQGQAAPALAAGFLGGINQSNLLFGITDWAIKNAKEQMLEVALNQFLADIKAVQIVKTMLPSTFNMLDTRNASSSLTDGQAWKSAFMSDLKAAPINLADVLIANVDSIQKLNVTQKTNLKHIISAYKTIFQGVQENKTPYLIFRTLAKEYLAASSGKISKFQQGLMLTDILLGSFVYESTEINTKKPQLRFVDPYAFASANNETVSAFFTLMLYRNQSNIVKSLKVKDITIARDTIDAHLDKVFLVTQKLGSVLEATNALFQAKDLTEGGTPLTAAKVNLYIELVLQLTDASLELVNEFAPMDTDETKHYTGLIKPFAKNVMLANQGIANQKYGDVIVAAVNTLNDVAIFTKSYNNTTSEEFAKAAEHINKYGKFMVDILYADSSQAVTQALTQLIPRNQYHLKQNSRFSVSLVVYPGVRFGRERLVLSDEEKANLKDGEQTGRFISPTLPIGFEAAWGYSPAKKKNPIGANGIFIHLIEAGALLNYRLSGTDEVESNPDVNFQMVFSPGAYFTTHFKKTPITLGVGYTLTPALRNIQGATLDIRTSAHQFGVFLAVDVTAFTFNTSRNAFKKYN